VFLATLVDLPCIIEAQKTLDFNTFYKSCDAAQMLYVHNVCIDQVS
jgi:TATA-binding protein-associated factor Taf7